MRSPHALALIACTLALCSSPAVSRAEEPMPTAVSEAPSQPRAETPAAERLVADYVITAVDHASLVVLRHEAAAPAVHASTFLLHEQRLAVRSHRRQRPPQPNAVRRFSPHAMLADRSAVFDLRSRRT
jgi:hypothetical protein